MHALIEVDKQAILVTLFEETIKQAMALAGKHESSLIDDLVTETMLGLPNLSSTYDRKTKIVSEVALLEQPLPLSAASLGEQIPHVPVSTTDTTKIDKVD